MRGWLVTALLGASACGGPDMSGDWTMRVVGDEDEFTLDFTLTWLQSGGGTTVYEGTGDLEGDALDLNLSVCDMSSCNATLGEYERGDIAGVVRVSEGTWSGVRFAGVEQDKDVFGGDCEIDPSGEDHVLGTFALARQEAAAEDPNLLAPY